MNDDTAPHPQSETGQAVTPGTTIAPTPPAPEGIPSAAHDGVAKTPGATERIWSLRTLAAVAITAVALSGAAGAGLAAASDGGSSGGPGGRGGFGGPPGQMGGQFPGHGQFQHNGRVPSQNGQPGGPPPGTNGVPGQLPPTTTNGSRDT
jgi:hypothetical protein